MLEIEAAWPINQPKAAVVALTLGIAVTIPEYPVQRQI